MADSEEPAVEEQQETSEPDLGKVLKDAREARGLSVEEIATELRIEARMLHALEACRFDELGAPVFAKGYLKQYGGRLGLDYRDLLSEYYRVVGSTEVQIAPSPVIKLRDERQIVVWVVAALAIALLIGFLAYWWFNQPNASGSPTFLPGDPDQTLPADLGQEEASPAVGAGSPSRSQGAAGDGPAELRSAAALVGRATESRSDVTESRAAPESDAAPEPDAAAPESGARPGDAARAGASIGAPTPGEASAAGDAPASGPDAVAVADPNAVLVELVFAEDCWAEITDSSGERRFYGLGEAGTRRSFPAVPPIRFFLGNADGVEIKVDGRDYAVPRSSRRGNLAQFSVDSVAD